MKLSNVLACGIAVAVLAATPFHSASAQEAGASPAVKAMIQAFDERMNAIQGSGTRITKTIVETEALAALGDLDWATLPVADIEALVDSHLVQYAAKEEDARKRLAGFAAGETADGAVAAVLLLALSDGEDQAEQETLVRAALHHPGLPSALSTGRAGSIFPALGSLPSEVLGEVFPDVVALAPHITGELPSDVLLGMPQLLNGLLELEGEQFAKGTSQLRERMVAALTAALPKVPAERKRAVTGQLEYLNGAYARGELIGHAAPELAFTWSSSEKPIQSLADLRGKVVVLDFWATWCGPCVASFPRVRELQEHYADYPVAIVGVTSLQGSHIAPDGTKTDTVGKPELEYELMAGYLPQKEVTWTVAFSEQGVFNPEYGIQGIPHVVILDAEGRVRFNGLHPMAPGKEEKIDALLKEAGLPCPGVKVEEAGFRKE